LIIIFEFYKHLLTHFILFDESGEFSECIQTVNGQKSSIIQSQTIYIISMYFKLHLRQLINYPLKSVNIFKSKFQKII
jgi:hypothetical protein